jgi:hypothetical protein
VRDRDTGMKWMKEKKKRFSKKGYKRKDITLNTFSPSVKFSIESK